MNCQICAGTLKREEKSIEGYVKNTFYEVYHCKNCNTSSCHPMVVDENIYNAIYGNIEQVLGYNRYHFIAEQILKEKDPFRFLYEFEDCYHSVLDVVKNEGKSKSFLEVGSGLGYLTYALNKSGYQCVGLDISDESVKKAKARFGEHYECGNFLKFEKKYDVIIMLELIEHIPDFMGFLDHAKSLLTEGGYILLTTPNKGFYKKYVWYSDLPPVHLFWFSKKSFTWIAKKLNLKPVFFDFSGWNKKHGIYPEWVRPFEKRIVINLPPRLDSDCKVLYPEAYKSGIAGKKTGWRHSVKRFLYSRFISPDEGVTLSLKLYKN